MLTAGAVKPLAQIALWFMTVHYVFVGSANAQDPGGGVHHIDQVSPACCWPHPLNARAAVELGVLSRPVFIRAGATFDLGGGFFEEHTDAGGIIQAGFLEPLWVGPDFMSFLELGGEYRRYGGSDRRSVTSGTGRFSSSTNVPDPRSASLNDFFETKLDHMNWGNAQLALGALVRSTMLSWSDERATWLRLRTGGRVGHVRAAFDNRPTDALLAVIANQQTQGRDQVSLDGNARETDTTWGLFGSVGIATAWSDVACFGQCVDVAFGVDLELAHDWFDLGAFGDDDGLGTASVLANFTIRF